MQKNKMIQAVVITAVIIGGISFYGGMKYGQNQTTANRQARMGQFGGGAGFGGAGGMMGGQGGQRARGGSANGGFISGEVISKDDKSVTVKVRLPGVNGQAETDSGSKIIFLSASTIITKQAEGSLNDIVVGQQITANGTVNSDGSITAQGIQIRLAEKK